MSLLWFVVNHFVFMQSLTIKSSTLWLLHWHWVEKVIEFNLWHSGFGPQWTISINSSKQSAHLTNVFHVAITFWFVHEKWRRCISFIFLSGSGKSGIPFDLGSNPLAHLKMCFMYQSLFDFFMKNAEGAFNLFSSVAVESLQFLLPLFA